MSDPAVPDPSLWWSVAEGSPISMAWLPDGTVLSVSDSCAALFGTTVDALVGARWPEMISPGDAELTEQAYQQLAATVEGVSSANVYTADAFDIHEGRLRVIRWYEWGTWADDGTLKDLRSVAIDVSPMYESPHALAEHMERLSQARSDERQRVAERLHDGAVQQLVAARWAVMDGDLDAVASLLDEALAAVRSSVNVLDQSDKATFPSGPDEVTWSDTAAAFHELTPARDAAVVFTASRVTWRSSSCDDVFGTVTLPSIRSVVASAHPDDRDGLMASALAALAGESTTVMWRYVHPDTGERLFVSSAHPLPGQDGRRVGLILTRDVTVDEDVGFIDQVRRLSRAAERAKVARELHDGVQQGVTALKWMVMGAQVDGEIVAAVEGLDVELRAETSRLHSNVSYMGLRSALEVEIVKMRTRTELSWDRSCNDVDGQVAEVVFRSVREALRNVDEHALASRARVTLSVADGVVDVDVVDNGIGVSPRDLVEAEHAGHLGVVSVREAVLALGGHFEILPGLSGGTLVRFHVPLSALDRGAAQD